MRRSLGIIAICEIAPECLQHTKMIPMKPYFTGIGSQKQT
ncbi:hypothetical protein Syncc8109_2278 [Synechococcus sp. WH 8109]|nr:hypothetical protein Syncc8109_2278 [Synechococcus sp. WH 8109]